MNDKDIMEICVDTYHLMYDYCADHEKCDKCIFKSNKRTQCYAEDIYAILRNVNNNYKRLKEEK